MSNYPQLTPIVPQIKFYLIIQQNINNQSFQSFKHQNMQTILL